MGIPAILPGQPIDFAALRPDTPISLLSGDREYRLSARDVLTWVAPNAPPADAVKFLVTCQITGLNPLLGEIDLLPFKGRWVACIRKNGYVKNAQSRASYDGHESGLVVQPYNPKDRSQRGPIADIAGAIVPPNHILIGGWAKAYRKGVSRPVYKRVALADYDRQEGTWKANPSVMIEKVAIAQAMREAFPGVDAYDESEIPSNMGTASIRHVAVERMPTRSGETLVTVEPHELESGHMAMIAGPSDRPTDVAPDESDPSEMPATPDQIEEIRSLAAKGGMNKYSWGRMLYRRGVSDPAQLDRVQAQQIINNLHFVVSVLDAPITQAAEPIAAEPVAAETQPETEPAPEPAPETLAVVS